MIIGKYGIWTINPCQRRLVRQVGPDHTRASGEKQILGPMKYWVTVREFKVNYHNPETFLFTIYYSIYIYVYIYIYYGNLKEVL